MSKDEFLNQLVFRVAAEMSGVKMGSPHDLLIAAVAEPWFAELGDDEQYEVRAALKERGAMIAAFAAERRAAAADLLVPVRRSARRIS